MYKKKDVIITGFALFAMLFGAGNLIFPPMVGFINGNEWSLATLGFGISTSEYCRTLAYFCLCW